MEQSPISELLDAREQIPDERILEAANAFADTVCMTSAAHESGTERLSEVVQKQGWDDNDIIVNVQGDEPLIPSAIIRQVADDLAENSDAPVATLAYPIQSEAEAVDANVVKVVCDKRGYALYFSRAAIPFQRDARHEDYAASALRHIGLYAYRAGFLKHYSDMAASPLESIEKLEQLRVLWHGMRIHVGIASEMPGHGVDTQADLQRVEQLLV